MSTIPCSNAPLLGREEEEAGGARREEEKAGGAAEEETKTRQNYSFGREASSLVRQVDFTVPFSRHTWAAASSPLLNGTGLA